MAQFRIAQPLLLQSFNVETGANRRGFKQVS